MPVVAPRGPTRGNATTGTPDVTLSGGWNAAFDARTDDPSQTVLDGENMGRVLDIDLVAGALRIENLTIANGGGELLGGGMRAAVQGSSSLSLGALVVEGNTADSRGGGAWLTAAGTSTLAVDDGVVFRNNTALISAAGLRAEATESSVVDVGAIIVEQNTVDSDTNNALSGGGMSIGGVGDGVVTLGPGAIVRDNAIVQDVMTGGSSYAGGVSAYAIGNASVTISETTVTGNTITNPHSPTSSMGIDIYMDGSADLVIEDSTISGNRSLGTPADVRSGGIDVYIDNASTGSLTVNRTVVLDHTSEEPGTTPWAARVLCKGAATCTIADSLLGESTYGVQMDATDWTDADIEALEEVEPVLALALNAAAERETTDAVLNAYLGGEAASRVRGGTIQRGDVTSIHAVIWFSDLRNSTPLAERSTPEEYMALLNAYFECTAGSVVEHGGEILRFIGDASLGIFPTDREGGLAGACQRAFAATESVARKAHARQLERGAPMVDYGIGLHLGHVLFGNIGIPSRIEFSVIGAAANEAARIEGLSKKLGEPTVVSAAVAEQLDLPWRSLGEHTLRGVAAPIEVFAPPSP